MKFLITATLLLSYVFVPAQNSTTSIKEYYDTHQSSGKSISKGKVSDGSLSNAKIVPYYGNNYSYFDSTSYLSGRAFLHAPVLDILLNSYRKLEKESPGRKFQLMECSLQNGGKMFPHKTHQNGTSIDFMMPLSKKGRPYYKLDTIGVDHYWLSFDDSGRYSEDQKVEIDFEEVAKHILILNEEAKKMHWKVKKVIIKIELKDELFSGTYGQKLKKSDIYVVQNLTPLINSLHDDHYHIDFVKEH